MRRLLCPSHGIPCACLLPLGCEPQQAGALAWPRAQIISDTYLTRLLNKQETFKFSASYRMLWKGIISRDIYTVMTICHDVSSFTKQGLDLPY